ncbi:hypothetical protein NEOKW01_0396 [Nematocida sp. AWRm80]|nr:hypothetical protein NEOKW01_0396 [Nematocida sp. AWRm80]
MNPDNNNNAVPVDNASTSTQTSSEKRTKQLQKIVNKPTQKRDTGINEDSDHSDTDSDTGEAGLMDVIKEEEHKKSIKSSSKSSVKKYKTLDHSQIHMQSKFSLLGIETYIESNFTGLMFYLVLGLYMVIGALLIVLPSLLALFIKEVSLPSILVGVSKQPSIVVAQENFKLSLYLAIMFITYEFIRELFNEIVYIVVLIYKLLDKPVTKDAKIVLFIVNDVKHLISLLVFFLMAVIECNLFLEDYTLFQSSVHGYQRIPAVSLCLVCLFSMFILEKFFLRLAIAYFGNNVFSNRISDINLQTSIIRRLLIYSEACRTGSLRSIIEEIDTGIEVTGSFLLHYDDFKIRSTQNCEEIAGTIYNRLNTNALTTTHFKSAFGSQWEDIWKFVISHLQSNDEEITEIEYNDLHKFIKSTYTEKTDIKRTLYDRDNLLGKLDNILVSVALLLTLIISTPIIGFDPIKYMAGLFPIIMSSGWLFSDIIKDVLNNFIFLLHEHPFDVGDKIVLKGDEYIVLRIELMYSTFTSKGGTVCYVPNKELIKEPIFNVRRSDIQSEIISFIIKTDISLDDIDKIKAKIYSILTSKDLDSKRKISIQDYELQGSNTLLMFKIEYLSNFQDPEPKFTRRQKPIEIIQSAIKSCGFSYAEQKTISSI